MDCGTIKFVRVEKATGSNCPKRGGRSDIMQVLKEGNSNRASTCLMPREGAGQISQMAHHSQLPRELWLALSVAQPAICDPQGIYFQMYSCLQAQRCCESRGLQSPKIKAARFRFRPARRKCFNGSLEIAAHIHTLSVYVW